MPLVWPPLIKGDLDIGSSLGLESLITSQEPRDQGEHNIILERKLIISDFYLLFRWRPHQDNRLLERTL